MNDLTVPPIQSVTTYTGVENPFQVVFRSAQPTLDAVALMREPLAWLDRRRNHRRFDRREVLAIVPSEDDLVEVRQLFRQAEHEPAPEGWTGLACAAMADAMPSGRGVSDTYVCAIVDMAYHDPETWGGYPPGYSFGVMARSVREALRQDGLPSPGGFIQICSRHRRQFRQWQADATILLGIRSDAIHGPVPF